jgi:hypothetical protein
MYKQRNASDNETRRLWANGGKAEPVQPTSSTQKAEAEKAEDRKRTGPPPGAKDDATFFYWQALDKYCAPQWHRQDRLADGRLILPLMYNLPRQCALRRCRRSKTCVGPEFHCLDELIEIAARRAKRLEADPVLMRRRWAKITASGSPAVRRRGRPVKPAAEGRRR